MSAPVYGNDVTIPINDLAGVANDAVSLFGTDLDRETVRKMAAHVAVFYDMTEGDMDGIGDVLRFLDDLLDAMPVTDAVTEATHRAVDIIFAGFTGPETMSIDGRVEHVVEGLLYRSTDWRMLQTLVAERFHTMHPELAPAKVTL